MTIAEIDASAFDLNLRMTEGDPINFQWTVEGAAAWAGTHIAYVDVYELTATVTVVNTTDALFTITSLPIPELIPYPGGYRWGVQEDGGFTRFAGLLFIEGLPS